MLVLKTIAETRSACARFRAAGKTLGLVPTMGALHEGHLSLVRAAQAGCDAVAVSIFVNPTQFGPKEDFAAYPRTLEEDCRILDAAGVDLVFAPSPEEMYPAGASTFVEVTGLSDRLDGASRPGHFRGVATVCLKLFTIAGADRGYFGAKDAHIPLVGAVDKIQDAHPDIPVYIYDAGHGFARKQSQDYDAASDKLAFERTIELFGKSA